MEDKWAKLEEIVRRVVREEIACLGKKERTKIKLVNGRWEGITPEAMNVFKEAYPAVDVEKQLKEMIAWIFANSGDAPKSNYVAFIQRWLKQHQDRHAIRSIPAKQDFQPKKLCVYCDQVATGIVNSIWHCRSHVMEAMDGKAIPRMRGIEAKKVAGE